MTAPRKLYGVSLKPRVKTPPLKHLDAPAAEVLPDMLEAVRRAVAENRERVEQPSQR
jgi:hypothetical protein